VESKREKPCRGEVVVVEEGETRAELGSTLVWGGENDLGDLEATENFKNDARVGPETWRLEER